MFAFQLSDAFDRRLEQNSPIRHRHDATPFFDDGVYGFQRIWQFCRVEIDNNRLVSPIVNVQREEFSDEESDGEQAVDDRDIDEGEVGERDLGAPVVGEPEVREFEVHEPEVREPEFREPDENDPDENDPDENEPDENDLAGPEVDDDDTDYNLTRVLQKLQKTYSEDFPGHQIYDLDLGNPEKIVQLENIPSSDLKCCICNSLADPADGAIMLTPYLSELLLTNGILSKNTAKGDHFGITFKIENDFDMLICDSCHYVDEGFVAFYPSIFRKNFIFRHNESARFIPFMEGDTSYKKRCNIVLHKLFLKYAKYSRDQAEINTSLAVGRVDDKYRSAVPLFEFRNERLKQYTGLTNEDLDDILPYLDEFEHNTNFIRVLNIRESVIVMFYKLRQDVSFEYLAQRIMEKKSSPWKSFTIKPNTVSQIVYKICYILGGRHQFAPIKNFFAESFMEHRVFRGARIGEYTNEYIGWDQSVVQNPVFLVNKTASALRKFSSLTSAELYHLIESFEDLEDSYLKQEASYLDDKEIVVVADATYCFTNRPSDLENLRRLYSTHKGDFLSKLMIYCSSAGYILQISGAWPANSVYNDSTILKIEAEHDKSLIEFFSSYINSGFKIRLICDRGFRDARAQLLAQFGSALTVVIPPLQNENIPRKDLSNTDKWRNKGNNLSRTVANGARIVTMERNIIERMNKLLKDWKFFSNKVNLTMVFNGFQSVGARIIGSLLNRRFIKKNWIAMDASNKMFRYNLYRAFYKNRYLEFGDIREPGLTFVLKEKLFFTYTKKGNSIWRNVFEDFSVWENFREDFPHVIHEPIKLKRGIITHIKRNDLFHMTMGDFHITRALEYLRSKEFIQNHFFMQVLRFDPSDVLSKKIQTNDLNSQSIKNLTDASQILINHFPNWKDKNMQLVRFLVTAECSPQSHRVYILYTPDKNFTEHLNEPDVFFQNRVLHYFCDW